MKSIDELRIESNGQTRILYHLNYWDGMISGVCLYNGKRCYFDTVDEMQESNTMSDEAWEKYCEYARTNNEEIDEDDRTEYNWWRIFAIYDTPDDVIERLDKRHRLFEKYVSKKTSYDINGKRINKDVDTYMPIIFDILSKRPIKIDAINWEILEKFQ